jgi:glycosyltransferase involved in cell wall biosynthesis
MDRVGVYIGSGAQCGAPLECQRYLLNELKGKDPDIEVVPVRHGKTNGLDMIHIPWIPTRIRDTIRNLRVKKVVSHVHGNIMFTDPHLSAHKGWKRRWKIYTNRLSRDGIDHFMPVSQFVGRTLESNLGITADKYKVVYNGINDAFFSDADDELPLDDEPYILHVSQYAPKKNVGTLLEAYRGLMEDGIEHRLLIVGGGHKGGPTSEMVRHLGLEDNVAVMGRVALNDLVHFYRHADLMVFPSLHETFGLPIIEAMASGCPVITSLKAAIPEVGGDAAIYVDPMNSANLERTIREVLEDPHLMRRMVLRGYERAELFTWPRAAQNVLSVYRKVMAE